MNRYQLLQEIRMYLTPRTGKTVLAYAVLILSLIASMLQPLLFGFIIDHILVRFDAPLLFQYLALTILCAVVSAGASIVCYTIFRNLTISHTLDIREKLVAHTRSIPIHEIDKHGAGKYAALIGFDSYTMANYVNHVIVEYVTQWFTICFAIVMIFALDWKLGLLALVTIPMVLIIPKLFEKSLSRYAHFIRTHNEDIGTHLYECVEGSKEIRAFGLEKWEHRRNAAMYKGLVHASTKETLFQMFSTQTTLIVISLIVVVLYGIGGFLVNDGVLRVGMLVAAAAYLNNVLHPLRAINQTITQVKQAEIALERVQEFFNVPVEHAQSVTESNGIIRQEDGSGPAIELENLSIVLDDKLIIDHMNLTIQRGQTVAVIGRSGSGKSTLFYSLVGFHEPTGGSITLLDQPHELLTRRQIQEQVAIVFQEPFLFPGTIYENIALGNEKVTEEEVMEAVRAVRLDDKIASLADGLHTHIYHKGFQLSGGQRQRIGIARALVKNADILILDEPTSALDVETERHVMEKLRASASNKTVLFSTHRLQTVAEADVIVVMDAGRVVEQGSHEELMQRGELYYELLTTYRQEDLSEPRVLERV
ncbi:ABC transporter ATP-binding protein/permease [Paenibacillus sp. SC116]|uniref:ABC transporter ATP-binding protein n=1 Tax=Paenibacillus sp. SC116 TaxID=2968986 RepID=UPI00215A6C5D|nr:ABC transporter ATP-binding protein [Paenibacillus sp. SC116]MCR8843209.1 ABC transporter ATP-binding protein/permease [Paenibacillus sp. SC116]